MGGADLRTVVELPDGSGFSYWKACPPSRLESMLSSISAIRPRRFTGSATARPDDGAPLARGGQRGRDGTRLCAVAGGWPQRNDRRMPARPRGGIVWLLRRVLDDTPDVPAALVGGWWHCDDHESRWHGRVRESGIRGLDQDADGKRGAWVDRACGRVDGRSRVVADCLPHGTEQARYSTDRRQWPGQPGHGHTHRWEASAMDPAWPTARY